MIQFDNLTKSFGQDLLFNEISFKINKSERCGLVGRNGSGKTTLLRLITENDDSDSGSITTPKQYKMGYLQQHLHFEKSTIREEASASLPKGEEENLYKVERILFGLGFQEDDMLQNPSDLSGGFQLRLHLAKVLASEPDCLLLDEPTNYLDIIAIRWFSRFLRSWPGELLIISHDRAFMDQVCTHTVGIHRQKILKVKGGCDKLYSQILQAEEIHEKTRQGLEKKRQHAEDFIKKFGAKATKASQAQSRAKALEKMPSLEKLSKLRHLDFSFNTAPFPGKILVEAKNIAFSYDSENTLIRDFSISIEKGDRLAIIGKNGKGKSTLLKLLAQELRPSSGTFSSSENIQLGYFGQTNIDRLNATITIEEEISLANPTLSYGEVRAICGLLMFSGDKAKKKISVLSGGEKSRVLLGRILASSCNFLLLDEPDNHLDMESVEALKAALEHFDGTVVIVSHSELLLETVPKKLVVCKGDEQFVFDGDYTRFLEAGGWEEGDVQPSRSKSTLSSKEKKQRRAEVIKNRSQALRPLKKEIEKLEKKITNLELEIERDNDALIQASSEGDNQKSAKLSQELGQKRKLVDTLFEQLEHSSCEHDEKHALFENELSELER